MLLLKKPGLEKTFSLSAEVGTVFLLWRCWLWHKTRAVSFDEAEFWMIFALEQAKRRLCLLGKEVFFFFLYIYVCLNSHCLNYGSSC